MQNISFPQRIAIIGGGRWARVLIGTICQIAPPSTQITIHSLHNAQSMREWATQQKLEQRIDVFGELPIFDPQKKSAVVVVNAARDHRKAIKWALDSNVPVIVEKPVTLSAEDTANLILLAEKKRTPFAAAHIFLFATYLESFSKTIKSSGEIQSLKIVWEDPKGESRYGEKKSYDSGLPIFADLIPHILSLTNVILPSREPHFQSLKAFSNGGAQMEIDIMLDNIPCIIELARDGVKRQRRIEVKTEKQVLELDFSTEPAMERRPSDIMLSAFFLWAVGGEFDPRLDIALGLRANKLIDEIASHLLTIS